MFVGMNVISCVLFVAIGAFVRSETFFEAGAEIEDFCQSETFQPRCLKNEVILINRATYGRMRIGRCITQEELKAFERLGLVGDDPSKIGCSEDVTEWLHRKCSGKAECEVRSTDFTNANIKPCFPMHNLYLEVNYDCINVVDGERSCIVAASKNPTHVIGFEVTEEKCGTKTQPFVVEAPIGERISVKLLEFAGPNSGEIIQSGKPCRSYGLIVDKSGKQNASICANTIRREQSIYLSSGNTLDIYLDHDHDDNLESNLVFILKLEAVGCSNLIPPKDAWLKRMDDTIVIGCYTSRQTWQLHCREGKWIGVMGNCSSALPKQDIAPPESKVVENTSNDKQVLVIVMIVGATVTFCLTVICTGAVCLRRFYSKGQKYQEYKTLNFPSGGNNLETQHFSPRIPDANNLSASMDTLSKDPVPTYSVYVGQSGITGTNS